MVPVKGTETTLPAGRNPSERTPSQNGPSGADATAYASAGLTAQREALLELQSTHGNFHVQRVLDSRSIQRQAGQTATLNDALALWSAWSEDLFELFATENETHPIARTGATYTKVWVQGAGEEVIKNVIRTKLEIKREQGNKDHLEWFLRFIDGMAGAASRKRWPIDAVSYRLRLLKEAEQTPKAGAPGGKITAQAGTEKTTSDQAVSQAMLTDAEREALANGREVSEMVKAKELIEKELGSSQAVEQWFRRIKTDASFLGLRIRQSDHSRAPGVHEDMLPALDAAANTLRRVFSERGRPGTDEEVRKAFGIYDIGGLRQPKIASGGTVVSRHSFGLAVDVNHSGNPFVGLTRKKVIEIDGTQVEWTRRETGRAIERATLLVRGEKINILAAPGRETSPGAIWDNLNEASEALKIYLTLDRESQLKDLLDQHGDTLRQAGYADVGVEHWKSQVRQDLVALRALSEFRTTRDPAVGLLDLQKQVVEALTSAGLHWGGTYPGAKDIMHFDWRGSSVRAD